MLEISLFVADTSHIFHYACTSCTYNTQNRYKHIKYYFLKIAGKKLNIERWRLTTTYMAFVGNYVHYQKIISKMKSKSMLTPDEVLFCKIT